MVRDGQGNLFAAITGGGQSSNVGQLNDGSIVEQPSGSSTLTTLAQFDGTNGRQPDGGLVLDPNGNLFGVTFQGGTENDGTIFELPVGSSTIDSLVSFTNLPGAEGLNPTASLAIDSAGNLFGETSSGGILPNGDAGAGTIFEVPAGTTNIVTLHTFNGETDFQDGEGPEGGLLLDPAGDLFGVAGGGATNHGLVFELPAGGGSIIHVADFTIPNNQQLGFPVSGVVADSAGDLFGETQLGVFEVPAGSGTVQSLGTFMGPDAGFKTETNVVLDGSGNVFGTTNAGGTFGEGTAFEIEKGSGIITTIANFDNPASNGTLPNVFPFSPLVPDGKGNFFGMTQAGGTNGFGFFYELSPAGPAQLSFGPPPADPIANQSITPPLTVRVEDSTGHVVTSDNSVVTLSIISGPMGASLVGNAPAAAVSGVATFPGLFVNLPGTYVFGAADGTLTPAQTQPITFSALPSSTITFPTASSYTPETWTGSIAGTDTVGVGTLASVGVFIFDGTNYWNGADGAFDSPSTMPIPNAATLAQSNWSYAFPAKNLLNGKTYTIQSQAEDSLGNLETLTAGMTFTFTVPAPTVTAISPSFGVGGAPQGPTAGTMVTITGTNLDDATGVSFGGLPSQFTLVSATQIQATAPPGGAGLVDIVVTNAGGNSAQSAADQFSYVTGTIIGGQQGSGFSNGPTLTPLANLPALPAGVTAEFSDAISFTVGNTGVGGTVTVVIQLPAGTLQTGMNYSYEKFNSTTNQWSTFAFDNGESVRFDVPNQQIDLTLTDGGQDDEDGTPNNSITDPGLPVVNPTAPPPIAKYAFTQLASFPTFPGSDLENVGLAMDSQGDLLAAVTTGGLMSLDANGNQIPDGSVVEQVHGTSTLNVLAQFNGANGAEPIYGVTLDSAGDLFGVTFMGGANQIGTIWELPVGSNTITALASFPAPVNAIGGIKPTGGLVVDSRGNHFGLGLGGTLPDGQSGQGVIYEWSPDSSQIQTLAVFNGVNGSQPEGTLLDENGVLLGAASGGLNGIGTAFELNDGSIQTVANFTPDVQGLGTPIGGLTIDQSGNLYGYSQNGVYEVAAGTSAVKSLARLINLSGTNDARGVWPLEVDSFGDLFGVTDDGGTFNQGTAFEIQQGSGKAVILFSFGGIDRNDETIPATPNGGLVVDGNGDFFGVTQAGGDSGTGYFYELSPTGATQLGFGPMPTNALATPGFQSICHGSGAEFRRECRNLRQFDGDLEHPERAKRRRSLWQHSASGPKWDSNIHRRWRNLTGNVCPARYRRRPHSS